MNRTQLNTIARIFGIGFLACLVLQAFALCMWLLMHDWAYQLQSNLFDLSAADFELAAYYFFLLMKVIGLTFFLVPWIAIKSVAGSLPD